LISSANVDAPAHRRSPRPPPRHARGDMSHHRGESLSISSYQSQSRQQRLLKQICRSRTMIVRQQGGRLSRAPFGTASLPNPWPTLRRDDGYYGTRARSFLERGTAASCPRGKLYAACRSARGRVEFLLLVMPSSASRWTGGWVLTFSLEGS
jgi:hypothetical protein